MKKLTVSIRYVFGFVASLLLLTSCSGTDAQKETGPKASHIIVIGVDAMSPNGIINAETPVLDSLMKMGAYTLNARGVLPTSSSTNWASMVSGAGPEQHGVTSNEWERDDMNFPPVTTGTEPIFPTIFGVARTQRPELEIGAIYTWSGFSRLIERSALNYDYNGNGDDDTTEKAIAYIKDKKPNFLFVHFDDVDHAGHTHGHRTPEYYAAVSHADSLIGKIVQSVKEAGIMEQTVFIISADHGGIGYGHGGETLDELEIPFIISGKGIKKGYPIKDLIYTYDNAATVAYVLGLQEPQAWIGRPAKSVFQGASEPELGDKKALIPAPVIYPKPYLYEAAGGLYIDKNATVKIETVEGTEIRYTTDGSVPDKNSTRYDGPFELDKSAVIVAKAFKGDQGESHISTAFFRLIKKNSDNGVHYNYYEGKDWLYLPIFEKMKPIKSGTVYEFRINDINQRGEMYGIQYKAYLQIDTPGEYRFYLNSDDGSNLYIDGEKVVDNDGGHGNIERIGTVTLKAGRHEVRIDYHNQAGGAWLDLYYKGPGIPKQIVPANKLYLRP